MTVLADVVSQFACAVALVFGLVAGAALGAFVYHVWKGDPR